MLSLVLYVFLKIVFIKLFKCKEKIRKSVF